jgi:hypothetical protein
LLSSVNINREVIEIIKAKVEDYEIKEKAIKAKKKELKEKEKKRKNDCKSPH